jgi:hypothetical protein
MPGSGTPLGEGLRKLERSTASLRATMDQLLDHLGIAGVTDEEVDRVLAEEARRDGPRPRLAPRRTGNRPADPAS